MKRKHKIMIARIVLAIALTIILLVIPMPEGTMFSIAFFAVPYLVAGYDVLWRAVRNILRGQIFDENFLMAIATVGAFGIAEYFEAVGVMIFYQTGELFSSLAVGKSRRSISALMNIRPDSATRLVDGEEETVFPEEIAVGDILVVRAGEKVALDGEIIEGESSFDLSALTGESMPVQKGVGDKVLSGTVNLSGVIKLRVESVFAESTVSKILDLVENAASKKAKSERFITRFARYYTPCVVIAAAALAVIPSIILGNPSEWIERALIFLMVSCPCALVISVPLSFFGGIGGASRRGILIKGATYLETLSKVDTVVFDKTGTLSVGEFRVDRIASEKLSQNELLEIAAYAESYSNHPIALSVCKEYGKDIDKSRIGDAVEEAGMGIRAYIDGAEYFVGNSRLMKKAGVGARLDCVNDSAIHISRGSEYLGYITLCDKLKEDSVGAIATLKECGIDRTVMLTGDSRAIAEKVGSEVGIDEIFSELLPAQKVEIVEKLISEGRRVAFVGDGINDAPVLSRADVGIAMGGVGSDAAIEAADIVLMDDKPSKIATAVSISRKTMRIVRQNIIFALTVKGVILLLGALGLAGMWTAVFGDVGVMVIAIINSMRTIKIGK